MLRARVLSDAGEQLVAQVDHLLAGNQQVIRGNPVRSVAELLAAPTDNAAPRSGRQAAREFLAAGAGKEPAPSPPDDDAASEPNGGKRR